MIVYGSGFVNALINKLPFEFHFPGYHYCGPGTKLEKRLAQGDPGINPLDAACKEHDIAYSKYHEDLRARHRADRELAERAWKRVQSKDSSLSEKATAFAVTNIMKAKTKLGMGVKHKKKGGISLRKVIAAAKRAMVKSPYSRKVIRSALNSAKKEVKNSGGRSKINKTRVIPLPKKMGGVLPLVPIFAGLSAVGALTGGAAGIAKAINDASAARKQLEESKRHNKVMENVSIGKGLYLKPYKTGNSLKIFHKNKKSVKKVNKI